MAHDYQKTLSARLADYDPNDTNGLSSKDEALASLAPTIEQIARLQEKLYASQRYGILVILQGMDTSGKDSLIKHAFSGVNPQGCMVHSFKAPSAFELSHTYLWRYVHNLPMRGMIKIFNRSYYEEVTTVRVHPEYLKHRGLVESKELWQRRYLEFNQFEEYLHHNNIIIIKVFLHISKDEQLKRLEKRINNPDKHWKFDISDIHERSHWRQYMNYWQETLAATHTEQAPWHILPANNKWYSQVLFSRLILKTLEKLHLHYPKVTIDLSKLHQELMK